MLKRAFGSPVLLTDPLPHPPEPLELDACYRYCESMARTRHHNFPVASLFLSSKLRKHIFAVYAFARSADDFVDEAEFEGRRASELDRWEEHLYGVYHHSAPTHPVFVALADTVKRFDLPITPFLSVLRGQRADLETKRYSTFSELRSFVSLSTEPMAQLFLYLSDYRKAQLLRYGAEFALGLAFANLWQDITADLARGYVYIPEEDLHQFGVTGQDVASFGPATEPEKRNAITALLRFEVARTRAHFECSRLLVDEVGDDIAVELAISWHGGMRMLDKIHRAGGEVLADRPTLHSLDKAQVVTRALAWRGGSLARRARLRALRVAEAFLSGKEPP